MGIDPFGEINPFPVFRTSKFFLWNACCHECKNFKPLIIDDTGYPVKFWPRETYD